MADFSLPQSVVTPLHINTAMNTFGGQTGRALTGTTAPSATTWVAKLVQYMPVSLPYPYYLQRFFWLNGSTVASTNVDMGIYTVGGQKLASTGSTGMSGASAIQYAAPTATMILAPGQYYLAWSCDNTTNRANTLTPTMTAATGELQGLLEETTGSFGLPATMTPVAYTRTFGAVFCGITRKASGF